jgi:homoserine O-acetyltransferase
LIGIAEDQLVPLADLRSLAATLAGPCKLFELSSIYGHDAFLKEGVALQKIFSEVLV